MLLAFVLAGFERNGRRRLFTSVFDLVVFGLSRRRRLDMKYRATILVLILLPILVGGGFALTKRPMNAPVIAILGAVMIWLGYTGYARRIDQNVIQPDAKKATPARMYMDGVDFMPTSRNVLYGYHFNSPRDVGYGTMTSSKRPGVAEARVALNEAIGATTTSTARRLL
jgi:Carbon starvation protein CstA